MDPQPYERGLKDAERKGSDSAGKMAGEMDRVERSLSDAGDTGKRAGSEIERGLDDASQAAGGLRGELDRIDFDPLAAGAAGLGAGLSMTFDDSRVAAGRLQAQLGMVGGAATESADVARQVYRDNFGGSMAEAFQVTGMVTQSLKLQGGELRDRTEDIFTISDAFGHVGADAQLLTDNVRTMKAAFPGASEEELLDRVAMSFQRGTGNAGDLADTLQEYPSFFSQLGLSASDMFFVLDTGMESGARNTDFVADAVKELGIRVNTLGDTGQDAIRRMFSPDEADRIIAQFGEGGAAARDAFFTVMEQLAATRSEQDRYNLAVELFGTKAEDLGAALGPFIAQLASGRSRTDELRDATGDAQAQYTGWANTLEQWKRIFQTSVLEPVSGAAPVFGGTIDVAANLATGLFALKAAGVDVAGGIGRATKAVGLLKSAALGPLGIALGVGVGLLGAWSAAKDEAEQATREYTEAIRSDTGELADNTRAVVVNRLEKEGLLDTARDLGIDVELLTDAILGEAGAQERLKRELDGAVGSTRDMSSLNVEALGAVNKLEGAVSREARAVKDAKDQAYLKAEAMGDQKAATDKATGAADDHTGAQKDQRKAIDSTKTAAERLDETFDELAGATIAAERAEIRFEEAVDNARKGIREHGKGLDTNREAGRRNREALLDLVEATFDHVGALADDGAKMNQLRSVFRDHRKDFRDTARQAGLTEDQIRDLEKQYGLVPGRVLTDVGVRGKDQAVRDARAISGALKGIGSSIADIRGRFRVSVGGSGGIPEATGDILDVPAAHMQAKIMRMPHRIGGEAGPESYIPLANDARRPRAIGLLRQTNELLGSPLVDPEPTAAFAKGGIFEGMWARPTIAYDVKKMLAAALGGVPGYRAMFRAVDRAFPWLTLISGFRPGAITATGNPSYHGMGRAIDINPSMTVFNWLRANYGSRSKELIFSPAGYRQIHNGRNHLYSGITRAMHWDHIHWAMRHGGIVDPGGPFGFTAAHAGGTVTPAMPTIPGLRSDERPVVTQIGETIVGRSDMSRLIYLLERAVGGRPSGRDAPLVGTMHVTADTPAKAAHRIHEELAYMELLDR